MYEELIERLRDASLEDAAIHEGYTHILHEAADALEAMQEDAERMAVALRLYIAAGFGNSTDFCKQAEAKRAATEALYHTTEQENDDD